MHHRSFLFVVALVGDVVALTGTAGAKPPGDASSARSGRPRLSRRPEVWDSTAVPKLTRAERRTLRREGELHRDDDVFARIRGTPLLQRWTWKGEDLVPAEVVHPSLGALRWPLIERAERLGPGRLITRLGERASVFDLRQGRALTATRVAWRMGFYSDFYVVEDGRVYKHMGDGGFVSVPARQVVGRPLLLVRDGERERLFREKHGSWSEVAD